MDILVGRMLRSELPGRRMKGWRQEEGRRERGRSFLVDPPAPTLMSFTLSRTAASPVNELMIRGDAVLDLMTSFPCTPVICGAQSSFKTQLGLFIGLIRHWKV